jgi:hypothetical protein
MGAEVCYWQFGVYSKLEKREVKVLLRGNKIPARRKDAEPVTARCAKWHFTSIVDKLKDTFIETKLEGVDYRIYNSFTEGGMERP